MNKKYLAFIIFLFLAIPLAWYLISPLFINVVVNENSPIVKSTQEVIRGDFVGADSFHKVEGVAIILDSGEKKYLRFENFKSTNGPDLKVWLAKDSTAKDYVPLGPLKGNIGNQNYEIPSDIDLKEYSFVLIWCEKFSVLFGSAKLSF